MDNSNVAIGRRIRKLRKKLNLTQVRLSEIIGCSSKHLSEIERGKTGISIDLQIELSNALHCSIDYLIKGSDFESVDLFLPRNVVETFHSNNEVKKRCLQQYLGMFDHIWNHKESSTQKHPN